MASVTSKLDISPAEVNMKYLSLLQSYMLPKSVSDIFNVSMHMRE